MKIDFLLICQLYLIKYFATFVLKKATFLRVKVISCQMWPDLLPGRLERTSSCPSHRNSKKYYFLKIKLTSFWWPKVVKFPNVIRLDSYRFWADPWWRNAYRVDCTECNKMLKVQDVQWNSHYLALVNDEINKKFWKIWF